MAYISEGLSLIESGLSGQSWKEWLLDSEDAASAVRVSGYITDAEQKGMQVGDFVKHRHWTALVDQYTRTGPVIGATLMVVASIAADGSADLTDGTPISVTDTD